MDTIVRKGRGNTMTKVRKDAMKQRNDEMAACFNKPKLMEKVTINECHKQREKVNADRSRLGLPPLVYSEINGVTVSRVEVAS